MRIAIAGAGEVGTHLAKLLSRENMDICLLDGNAEHLGDLEANYDLMTRVGSPTSIHDIHDMGIKEGGKLAITAVQTRDMPLLQGTVLFAALLVAVGNIAADVINRVLEPRLKNTK